MWHGTRADVTRHARPRGRGARAHAAPRWHGGGADVGQRSRESTWTPGWHHGASEEAGS